MRTKAGYVGIHKDAFGGMTELGRIIRDAWVFGIIPESETCAGWDGNRLQQLYDQVNAAWSRHGMLPSALPDELRARHARIHGAAMEQARAAGWDPELAVDERS